MAAILRLKHTHIIAGKWRWIAPPWARTLGAHSETLGPALTVEAIVRSRKLTEFWESARRDGKTGHGDLRVGTVAWLIRDYQQSRWYLKLARRTKEDVDFACRVIEEALGGFPVPAIERRHVRRFHDKLARARSPIHANKMVKWLRRLMSYAVEIGLRADNPALRMELEHGPGRDVVWKPEEVEAFKQAAVRSGHQLWALAVQLGYDTSQRLGDILTITWHQFDGEGLAFKQAKTGRSVWVPLSPESLRMLAVTKRRSVNVIVGDGSGKPITSRHYFARVFREIRAAAGLREELNFRDLRRTAATEILAGGGRAEPVTGHRPGSTVLKFYEIPTKEASRAAQAARTKRDEKSKS